jgi:predicted SpoU family rRNA methylase
MKKKKFIIILIIILVLILGGLLFYVFSGYNKKVTAQNRLKEITEEFYGYYYDENKESIKETLEKFKDTGLRVSLGDMEVYINSSTEKENDFKALEKCDVDKTEVIIKPHSPYGKKDYNIKIDKDTLKYCKF